MHIHGWIRVARARANVLIHNVYSLKQRQNTVENFFKAQRTDFIIRVIYSKDIIWRICEDIFF